MNYFLRWVTMNRILLLFFTLLIYGCATKPFNNANKVEYNNYHEVVSKSASFVDMKNYLLTNNLKLGSIVIISWSQVSGLANFMVDGISNNLFTTPENRQWLRATMDDFVTSEFAAFVKSDAEGIFLNYCGDFANASVGNNGTTGVVEYTYFLTNMTDIQRKNVLTQSGLSDCNYDAVFGDIIYKKKIKVSSSIETAKLSFTKLNDSLPFSSWDNVGLLIRDMSSQAMTAMLTDADLFQALKDYKLTGGKKSIEPVVNKIPVSESSSTTTNNQVPAVNMEKYKAQCKELGFKLGTTDYGNCVLQLMK